MTPSEPVDLFVGQMIALTPRMPPPPVDAVLLDHMQRLFPLATRGSKQSRQQLRPRTYLLMMNRDHDGVLTAGGTEINVTVLPLDVDTPAEATPFRVVAIAGRAIRISGVATGRGLST
ncbi:MAG: hypothetical protein QM677_00945 [Microbacterium sp.]